jgi:hypothetical protein
VHGKEEGKVDEEVRRDRSNGKRRAKGIGEEVRRG